RGDLAARYAGEGEDRGRRPTGEQWLRKARGCCALCPVAVQRPPAEPERCEAGAEGRSADAGAAVYHLPDRGAERDVDCLLRRLLRQGSRAGAVRRALADTPLATVPRIGRGAVLLLLLLGGEAGEIELGLELDPELARLRPAADSTHRTNAKDVDGDGGARCYG